MEQDIQSGAESGQNKDFFLTLDQDEKDPLLVLSRLFEDRNIGAFVAPDKKSPSQTVMVYVPENFRPDFAMVTTQPEFITLCSASIGELDKLRNLIGPVKWDSDTVRAVNLYSIQNRTKLETGWSSNPKYSFQPSSSLDEYVHSIEHHLGQILGDPILPQWQLVDLVFDIMNDVFPV